MSSPKTLPILIIIGSIFAFFILFFSLSNKFKQRKTNPTPSTNIITNPTTDNTSKNTPTTKTQYAYKNENINFNTYFPDNFLDTGSNIKFETKDSSIVFSPLKSIQKTTATTNKNQILYPKIFQNGDKYIDLRYTLESTKLIEEFILNQKQIVPKLEQKVNLFNAYPTIDNNQINFLHPSTDKYLFKIPVPYMYEQNNPSVKHNGIIINLQCENPKTPTKDCRSFIFTKEITPEGQQWLDDPTRQYPVIIDPFVDGGPCWGSGGYCDSGCVNSSVNSASVYTTCAQGTLCTGTNCWYTTAGTCNANCTIGTTTPVTGYPSCTSTFCGTPACFQLSSACNAGCQYITRSSFNTYATVANCNAGVSGNVDVQGTAGTCTLSVGTSCWAFFTPRSRYAGGGCTSYSVWDYSSLCDFYAGVSKYSYARSGTAVVGYTGSGACSTNCFQLSSPTSYNTSDGACDSAGCGTTTLSQATKCNWAAATYPWNATVNVTKYTSGGTPCADNSGNCFKLTNGATSWTGSGTGCPTGSSTCVNALTRYDSTQCTWYPGTGGTDIKIDGLMIEGIKIN